MAHYSPPPDSNDSDCITITIKNFKKKSKFINNKSPSIISHKSKITLPFNNN